MQRYVIFTSTDYDDEGRPNAVHGVHVVPPCFAPNQPFLARAAEVEVDIHLSEVVDEADGLDLPAWVWEGGRRMWDLLSIGPDREN